MGKKKEAYMDFVETFEKKLETLCAVSKFIMYDADTQESIDNAIKILKNRITLLRMANNLDEVKEIFDIDKYLKDRKKMKKEIKNGMDGSLLSLNVPNMTLDDFPGDENTVYGYIK